MGFPRHEGTWPARPECSTGFSCVFDLRRIDSTQTEVCATENLVAPPCGGISGESHCAPTTKFWLGPRGRTPATHFRACRHCGDIPEIDEDHAADDDRPASGWIEPPWPGFPSHGVPPTHIASQYLISRIRRFTRRERAQNGRRRRSRRGRLRGDSVKLETGWLTGPRAESHVPWLGIANQAFAAGLPSRCRYRTDRPLPSLASQRGSTNQAPAVIITAETSGNQTAPPVQLIRPVFALDSCHRTRTALAFEKKAPRVSRRESARGFFPWRPGSESVDDGRILPRDEGFRGPFGPCTSNAGYPKSVIGPIFRRTN